MPLKALWALAQVGIDLAKMDKTLQDWCVTSVSDYRLSKYSLVGPWETGEPLSPGLHSTTTDVCWASGILTGLPAHNYKPTTGCMAGPWKTSKIVICVGLLQNVWQPTICLMDSSASLVRLGGLRYRLGGLRYRLGGPTGGLMNAIVKVRSFLQTVCS